ncbi:hypothetical protein Shyhy01_27180 [Streptomyces hygroscopicus subsp. hygroscopicus]|nr:hypothetical protein Shyhy01_27180 [Streptomyces hygroscopicus subsp. hygroscopicus]
MGDDLDGEPWCVGGHRVMVPPRWGTWDGAHTSERRTVAGDAPVYVTFALDALYKGWAWTHRHGLWCSDGPWEKLTAYRLEQ